MNGTIKLGSLMTFVGGLMVAYGIDDLDKNLWSGLISIAVGVIADVSGISKVDKGVKEAIRLHDLEKVAVKANKIVR